MSGKSTGERGAVGRLVLVPALVAGLVTAGCGSFENPFAKPSPVQPRERAYELYERGAYVKAYWAFRPLADQGDANAQFAIGHMYEAGKFRSAFDWLDRKPEYTEAAQWYRKAAEQGYAKAQSNLGRLYAGGHGVGRDDAVAANWYRKAAIQGLADAQYNIGKRYYDGAGVPRDNVLAHSWASIAAANSTGMIRQSADKLRDLVTARMEPGEISEAQRLAREWKPGEAVAPPQAVAPARASASAEADIESRLRTLKKLWDQGLITEDDYADRRKEILQGL